MALLPRSTSHAELTPTAKKIRRAVRTSSAGPGTTIRTSYQVTPAMSAEEAISVASTNPTRTGVFLKQATIESEGQRTRKQ